MPSPLAGLAQQMAARRAAQLRMQQQQGGPAPAPQPVVKPQINPNASMGAFAAAQRANAQPAQPRPAIQAQPAAKPQGNPASMGAFAQTQRELAQPATRPAVQAQPATFGLAEAKARQAAYEQAHPGTTGLPQAGQVQGNPNASVSAYAAAQRAAAQPSTPAPAAQISPADARMAFDRANAQEAPAGARPLQDIFAQYGIRR